MKSDIEIAQSAEVRPIEEIGEKLGIPAESLIPYGRYKAKISADFIRQNGHQGDGNLILVTAMSPTPAGEGKTTTTVGLGDALNLIGKQAVICLREPSLGPCFGMKGGAAGGGYAQVVPMTDINLHFTGDFHAIGAANNLLAALIDNHMHWENELNIDPRRVTWRRVVDINDRTLRSITSGLGGFHNGVVREAGFDITVASEVMAIFCLSTDLQDLENRLGNIVLGYTRKNEPVTVRQLNAQGAMTALLRDALQPNLVQSLESNPALMHGGPFANIAHGCNSVIATSTALKLADYVVTEAGFGADLGAEKFFDIKCRKAGLKPDAVVLVATIRALQMQGGVTKDALGKENVAAVKVGCRNLGRHIRNLGHFGVPVVVAINRFTADTDAECRPSGNTAKISECKRSIAPTGRTVAKAQQNLPNRWPNCVTAGSLSSECSTTTTSPCGRRHVVSRECSMAPTISSRTRKSVTNSRSSKMRVMVFIPCVWRKHSSVSRPIQNCWEHRKVTWCRFAKFALPRVPNSSS